jgi:hypothetical protein
LNWPTRKAWLITAALVLALSVAAVSVNASLRYGLDLGVLAHMAEQFASPGELLWWSTLGGAFAGRPTGATGIALWVIGTALFWFFVAAVGLVFLAWVRHRLRP